MGVTGLTAIDHSPQVVAEWLNGLCDRLDWTDNRRAYLLLRTTLHALRDWLTVDEASDLAAQLPLLIRGIYYEGWNSSSTPAHPRSKDDFVARVTSAFAQEPLDDPELAISAVFGLLEKNVSGGEIDQVRKAMRSQLRDLWP